MGIFIVNNKTVPILFLCNPQKSRMAAFTVVDKSLREKKGEKIKSWLDAWVRGGSLPNGVVGVFQNDEEVLVHATGFADVNAKIRCARDTIFRIYSMTKPLTTVSILILAERGLLSVHDRLDKYLPEFSNLAVYQSGTDLSNIVTVPTDTPVTLHHLLTHTSGISYSILTTHVCGRILTEKLGTEHASNLWCDLPLETMCRSISEVPLCFQPGTAFMYGFNSDVLGRVIEV